MRRLRIPALVPAIATLALAAGGCGGGGPVAQTQVTHDTVKGGTGHIEFTVQRPASDAVAVQIERHVGDTATEHNLLSICPGLHIPVVRRIHAFAFACVPIRHTSHSANFEVAQILAARGGCKPFVDNSVLIQNFDRPCDVTYSAAGDPGTDGRLDLTAVTIRNGAATLGQSAAGATFREGISLG